MAKIPEETIITIRQTLAEGEGIGDEIKILTNHVNADSVDWNGIEIPITSVLRDEMVARYQALKLELQTIINTLP